jgi:cytoskeleton protein RodZ
MSHDLPSDSNTSVEPAAATESLGAWLAQTRAGFNAEQREVARHLGLNPTLIEAIENDHFDRLGPPVFVRGYLTRYARLLNLPESDVLERYRLQSNAGLAPPPLKVTPPFQRQTRLRDLRGVFYLLMLMGIAWTAIQNLDNLNPSRLLALWSDGSGKTSTTTATPATANTQTQYPFQSEPRTTVTTSQPASTTALATENAPPGKKAETPHPASMMTPPDSATPAATPSAPTQPTASPSAAGVLVDVAPAAHPTAIITALPSGIAATTVSATNATTDSGTVSAPGEAKLLLEFSNECWVEVRDAQGTVLVNGLMKPNSTRAISGAAPFKVTLGNAPATRILLDDRLVNTEIYVPRRGTVSRFTLDRGQP